MNYMTISRSSLQIQEILIFYILKSKLNYKEKENQTFIFSKFIVFFSIDLLEAFRRSVENWLGIMVKRIYSNPHLIQCQLKDRYMDIINCN